VADLRFQKQFILSGIIIRHCPKLRQKHENIKSAKSGLRVLLQRLQKQKQKEADKAIRSNVFAGLSWISLTNGKAACPIGGKCAAF